RQPTDALATFNEERQLARRELQARRLLAVPERRELSLLEALGEQAQAGSVEVQDLGAFAVAAHEEEQVARDHAALHLFFHDGRLGVERLAHFAGLRVREHAETAGQADHERRLHSSAMPSTPSPSTRMPRGPNTTAPRRGCSNSATTTSTRASLVAPAFRHVLSVTAVTPSSSATRPMVAPSPRRRAR